MIAGTGDFFDLRAYFIDALGDGILNVYLVLRGADSRKLLVLFPTFNDQFLAHGPWVSKRIPSVLAVTFE